MHQMCLYSVQAYAHDVSSTPGRSNGGHIPVPTPPPSHPDSTASAPDTGDVASSLPSQYHSGGPETPPVNTMAQAATEAVTAAHPAALDENDTLQPVSYGAHTTMQPQLLASAFSAADDPPLLQQSWQQDALWKGEKPARPAGPPREYAFSLCLHCTASLHAVVLQWFSLCPALVEPTDAVVACVKE